MDGLTGFAYQLLTFRVSRSSCESALVVSLGFAWLLVRHVYRTLYEAKHLGGLLWISVASWLLFIFLGRDCNRTWFCPSDLCEYDFGNCSLSVASSGLFIVVSLACCACQPASECGDRAHVWRAQHEPLSGSRKWPEKCLYPSNLTCIVGCCLFWGWLDGRCNFIKTYARLQSWQYPCVPCFDVDIWQSVAPPTVSMKLRTQKDVILTGVGKHFVWCCSWRCFGILSYLQWSFWTIQGNEEHPHLFVVHSSSCLWSHPRIADAQSDGTRVTTCFSSHHFYCCSACVDECDVVHIHCWSFNSSLFTTPSYTCFQCDALWVCCVMRECVSAHEDGRAAGGWRHTRMYTYIFVVLGIYMFCCSRMCLYNVYISYCLLLCCFPVCPSLIRFLKLILHFVNYLNSLIRLAGWTCRI